MTDTSDPRVCPTPDLDNGREPKHPKHPKRDPRCPPCDPPPLCELDCLVRPEFHCGQELTEDDLNALVRWTDRRLARVRYRDGWGVVCGLDLCIDPHCPTRVTVSSGYAVDCCGDDLVLCDTGCIDLRDCCPDPCLPAETDQSQAEKIEKRFDQEMAERLGIAHLPFRFRKCVGVDICLEHDDCPVVSIPQPGCGCGGSGDRGCGGRDCRCGGEGHGQEDPCSVTRRREGARLVLCMANETRDPVRDFAEDWEATCHVGEEIKRLLKDREDDPEALREILTRFHLCSVGIVDRILEAVTLEDSGPTWTQVSPHLDLVTLLFWLIYDRRLRLGSRHCHDCNETDRVCLGRAWLFTGLDRRDRTFCFIGWLDTADPVRRRLSPYGLPAPGGHVNLAGYLGRDPATAALALAGRGIAVSGIETLEMTALDQEQLSQLVEASPFAAWSDSVVLICAETGHGRRVVGWRRTARGQPVRTSSASARPAAAATKEPPQKAEPATSRPVEKLPQVGRSRGRTLRAAGVETVADFLRTDEAKLAEIVKEWARLPGDTSPEAMVTKLRAAAAEMNKEGGGS